MRKKAFSLAELLLALTIVGIVASYTIPALIIKVQESTNKIAWKSAFSNLNQATIRLMTDNGGTLNGVFQNASDVKEKYSQYLSLTKKCTPDQNCWHAANTWYNLNGVPRNLSKPGSVLSNGNLVLYELYDPACADNGNGILICGYIYVDTNGFKMPNTVGKDIYLVWIQHNKITPAGSGGDGYEDTCSTSSNGWGCATKYLMQ